MFKKALTIAYKDLQIESGKRAMFTSLLMVSFILTFLSSFVVIYNPKVKPELSAVVIWLILISISLQILNRSLAAEDDAKCWDALCLCPISLRTIFLGKFIYNSCLTFVILMMIFPLYLIFFDLEMLFFRMMIPIFLAIPAFNGIGLLVALFSLKQQGREMFMNAMCLPFTVPVLFAGLRASLDLSTGLPFSEIIPQLKFLLIFDVCFVVISFFAFGSDFAD